MMTARQNGKTSSIKMVNNGGGKDNRIEFVGTAQSITFVLKSTTTHPFDLGDMMEYVGFATINGVEYESDRISQAQNSSQTFMLRFDVARPEVTTQNATDITATAATLNGEVTDDHNANVTERGFCYGTSPSPSLNGSYIIVGSGTGTFSSGLAELTPATNYYVRAYATNMLGTAYGQQKVFHTLDTLPVVTTTEPSGITATTFTSGGEVTVLNSASLTARGVCWNTTGTPTLADNHTTQSGGLGSFTSIVEGLACGTTYYVRAYATNSAGTAYGEEYNVTTTDTLPEVEILTSQVNATSLAIQSEVLSENCAAVTARGVCWNTAGTPTVADSHTTDGVGVGSFTSSLTDLVPATDYYVRAYATNSVGTAYGQIHVYHTLDTLPVVTTIEPSDVSTSSFLSGGEVTVLNSASLTARGICWNTTGTPTVADSHTTESGDLGSFTSNVEGLSCGTTYYVRAYATNNAGTAYGEEYSVTTMSPAVPEVVLSSAILYNGLKILTQSEVITENCSAVIERGICWSTSPAPTVSGDHIENGEGVGVFVDTLTGLETATTYYIRAYATNEIGTAYSEEEQRGTPDYPTVSTSPVTGIASTTATCGGNVIADGGATVTARGVCWSTSQNPTIADSHTTDSSGIGSYVSSIMGLAAGITYYVRAYATNSVGTTYGEEMMFTTAFNCGIATLTDIDGNTYNTVQIGTQCWMKENLRTTKYADGTLIQPRNLEFYNFFSDTVPYWYYPNRDSANKVTYGLLYNWKAVMRNSVSASANPSGVQGICPAGWHLPNDEEWTQLTDYVSSQSRYVCGNNTSIAKALADTRGWRSGSNTCHVGSTSSGNNATGFSALPASHFSYDVHFWSATEYNRSYAWSRILSYNSAVVDRSNNDDKSTGCSVRCLRDDGRPSVITTAVSDITENTATCGGNVTDDGGADVTVRGFCWNTTGTPTLADSHTIDGSGTGSYASSITGLTAGITYYVRAYATNSVGTAYGEELRFSTAFNCGVTILTDCDSNTYNTVQVGTQCWMKENLRTTKYADGTTVDRWYYPGHDSSNITTYGLLYLWETVMGNSSSSSSNPSRVQGICPIGWHVPNDEEWTQLTDYVSSQSQYVCGSNNSYIAKALADTTGWRSQISGCSVGATSSNNNATGFSALPAGDEGVYINFGSDAYFWSATECSSSYAWSRSLSYTSAVVSRYCAGIGYGYSVRCLRDDRRPTVITTTVSDITGNTATCGGNVTDDGGTMVTVRGVCWSTSQNPTLADQHTTDGSDLGGFTSRITGLKSSTTYYVRAYATNSEGTAYGNEVCFTTTFYCGSTTLTDIDGNTYNTVQIGSQCWMKQNLKTTKYADGTSISQGSGTSSTTVAYWYYPNNNSSTKDTYGLLYNWKAVMRNASSSSANPSGVQGICPTGWHVPSDAEWKQMEMAVGMSQSDADADGYRGNIAAQLSGNTGWTSSTNDNAAGNQSAPQRNSSGFSALPAGRGVISGGDLEFRNYAEFWSATEYNSSSAWYRYLFYNTAKVNREKYGSKDFGYSVRCIRDATQPVVITSGISNITANSASCVVNLAADGGARVTTLGVCWSTSHNPTLFDSHTHTIGSVSTGSYTISIMGLTENTTYYVRAYATNSAGTAYGEEVRFTTLFDPCGGISTLIDCDFNIYNTVQIGTQCWMKENLRTTKYADGTSISQGSGTSSTTVAYWYYPNNNSSTKDTYGLLYNWKAVMRNASSSSANPSGVQGICPTGWHVPSDAEWKQMEMAVGMSQSDADTTGYRGTVAAKLSGNTGWTSSSNANAAGNQSAMDRNSSGFSALPAGNYNGFYNGLSGSFGKYADFWSATESDTSYALHRGLEYSNAGVRRSKEGKRSGFSVRCLRAIPPMVTTNAISNITENSVTCGGNVTADADVPVTARGVCWNTLPNPTVNDSHTNDDSGTGNYVSSITGLTAGNTYYVRAYATNSVGTAYGEQMSFTLDPCNGSSTLTDHDGNTYNTVQIGPQCWMKENLRTTTYADGTSILQGSDTSTTVAYWYYPNNNSSNKNTYGLLYNWKAVMRNSSSSSFYPSEVQGICPTGWHVPSDAEWRQLIDYVSSQSQYWCDGDSTNIAKALAGTTGWASSTRACAVGDTPSSNDATGFSARGAGYYNRSYVQFRGNAFFWSTTEDDSSKVWSRGLSYQYEGVSRINYINKNCGSSVRCVKD